MAPPIVTVEEGAAVGDFCAFSIATAAIVTAVATTNEVTTFPSPANFSGEGAAIDLAVVVVVAAAVAVALISGTNNGVAAIAVVDAPGIAATALVEIAVGVALSFDLVIAAAAADTGGKDGGILAFLSAVVGSKNIDG